MSRWSDFREGALTGGSLGPLGMGLGGGIMGLVNPSPSSGAGNAAMGSMLETIAQVIEQQQRQQQMDARLGEVAKAFESPENARRINQMVDKIFSTARERGDMSATATLGDMLRQARQRAGGTGTMGGSMANQNVQRAKATYLGNREQSATEATQRKQVAQDSLRNLRQSMEAAVRSGQWAPKGSDVFAQQRQALSGAAAGMPTGMAQSIFLEDVAPTAASIGARGIFAPAKTKDAGGY